ncbi:MAG TPA: dienelactone hydrolase family protein, partial [Gaiellales bacterium]|nr:dienelactone hydrolase family protein [Gaiellales bacterium]
MSTEVTVEHVDIDAADGTADAVFVHPASRGPHPGVLLYMDAYGIRPALEAHAARLAAGGYCVLVPNVFYRTGRSPVLENLEQLMQSEDRSALFAQLGPKIQAVTPEAANADAGAW